MATCVMCGNKRGWRSLAERHGRATIIYGRFTDCSFNSHHGMERMSFECDGVRVGSFCVMFSSGLCGRIIIELRQTLVRCVTRSARNCIPHA